MYRIRLKARTVTYGDWKLAPLSRKPVDGSEEQLKAESVNEGELSDSDGTYVEYDEPIVTDEAWWVMSKGEFHSMAKHGQWATLYGSLNAAEEAKAAIGEEWEIDIPYAARSPDGHLINVITRTLEIVPYGPEGSMGAE